MRRLMVAAATSAVLVGVVAITPSAFAATVTPPDLQILVPTANISIGNNPSTGHRQLQFTHITWDAGTGPFAIQPSYNSATGLSSFRQVVYQSSSPGVWTVQRYVPLAVDGIFEAPSDYRYPLTRFTLNRVNSDGSVGTVVATSPKVDYCITADTYVGGVPNTPNQTSPPQGDCTDPTKLLGLSVGWGDQYDQTDNGQPIDLTSIPDGTYVLQATVDPQHIFFESNRANDVVDTKVRITGDQVTVLAQTRPTVVPPTVTMTSPAPGATVKGSVTLTARPTAPAPATVSSVQFLLDGVPLGPRLTSAPWSYTWSTGTLPATHTLSVQVTDSAGMIGTAAPQSVTVAHTVTPGLSLDGVASGIGHGTVHTGALRTYAKGDTLLAFVSADGPETSAQSATVSGAGVTWHLVRRSNHQAGDAEIWTATASGVLTTARVTSIEHAGGFAQQLVVYAFSGSRGVGASRGSSGSTGSQSVSVTTTAAGSDIFAVGTDWDNAIARTAAAGQSILNQWIDSGDGDTFWVQRASHAVATSGTVVRISDSAPTTDRWDYVAVEVKAAPLTSGILRITDPAPGEIVSGETPIALDTWDSSAVGGATIRVGARVVAVVAIHSGRAEIRWASATVPNGPAVLDVSATDQLGRQVSARVAIDVHNPRPPMTCFVLQADSTVSGRGTLSVKGLHVASTGERLVALVRGDASAPVSSGVSWRLLSAGGLGLHRIAVWTATVSRGVTVITVSSRVVGVGQLSLLALEGTEGIGRVTHGTRPLSLSTERDTSLVLAVVGGLSSLALPHDWVPLVSIGGHVVAAYTNQPVSEAGTVVRIPVPTSAGVEVAVELPGDGS